MAGNPSLPCPRRCQLLCAVAALGACGRGHMRAAVEVAGCRAVRPGCACSAGLRQLGGWPGPGVILPAAVPQYVSPPWQASAALRADNVSLPGRPEPGSTADGPPPQQCPAGSSPLRPRHGRDWVPAGIGSGASLRYRRVPCMRARRCRGALAAFSYSRRADSAPSDAGRLSVGSVAGTRWRASAPRLPARRRNRRG